MENPVQTLAADADRRRYFRIADRIALRIRRPGQFDKPGESSAAATRALLDIDVRLTQLFVQLRSQAPELAELGELLNSKINHLLGILGPDAAGESRSPFREYPVTISACGISFAVEEYYESNDRLIVEMMYGHRDRALRLMARVVRCDRRNSDGYQLQMDFPQIDEDDQETLIQTIVRRQGSMLQRLREGRTA
jgi:PilZ domain